MIETKPIKIWEFLGGLVVRIPGFHCHGLGSVPGQEIEILQVLVCSQKKKKKTKQNRKKHQPSKFHENFILLLQLWTASY